MAIGDVFKSKQERERDELKKRRKAFREAEKAVDTVKDRIAGLKKDRDKAWAEGRQYLKDGQKAAAQRSLQTCRANEIMMSKLETKRWVFAQLLTKLEMAKTDQDFSGALSAINTVVKIDPEAVADVLADVEDKLGDQIDTDKIWEKMHGKEMEGVEGQLTDQVPSLGEMEKQLQDEVVASMDDPTSSSLRAGPRATTDDDDIKSRIGDGRKRLRDLLEGDQ